MTSTACPTFNLFLFPNTEFGKNPTENFVCRNDAGNFSKRVSRSAHIDRDQLSSHPALYGLKGLAQRFTGSPQRVTVSHVRDRDTLRCLNPPPPQPGAKNRRPP